ncbi:MAG TPA: ABC transporter permease [candidate division WOR-3 bacterium]|uniref:ABC transporter permease n=1 Tax=candidate division WOR-3 bacterium TaxID=2052148 RepID=A0A9C9ELQ2_UNCW3|nr:ABC transporter permease [candidate division WOR-3 bacterium]
MQTPDISNFSLFLCSLLLIIPFVISIITKLGIIKTTLISVARMAIQLVLIGIFLKYLFLLNSSIVNILWLVVMIVVATFNVTRKVKLKFKIFFLPTCISFLIATFAVILYFTTFVLNLKNILDARFFVVVGGMLLGNSLRGNIIGITDFYKSIRRDEQRYLYRLSVGATVMEALLPYLRNSLSAALQPTIATMATMGIVFLPGMMTGQILGGLSPLLAIKYQIAIMIAIFVSTTIAINLTILLTTKTCFDGYGLLKKELFDT